MNFGFLDNSKEKFLKPFFEYLHPILLFLLIGASLYNSYSIASFFLIIIPGVTVVIRSIYLTRRNLRQEKIDLLVDAIFLLAIIGMAFFYDVYHKNINTHDLFRVEDEFKVLGTIGDFFGGASSSLVGLFTLLFVINESRENRKINDARDRREDRKELYDLNQLMLSMFIKRVEFLDNKLSSLSTYYGGDKKGLSVLKVYGDHRLGTLKDEAYSFLTHLDDLVEESISISSIMALGKGVDVGVKSIRDYKTKVLAGLLSTEHLDVYWKILRNDENLIKKTSYICALLVILKNNDKEIFDLNDDDFINIDLFYKSLIVSEKKMNFIMINCDKLS